MGALGAQTEQKQTIIKDLIFHNVIVLGVDCVPATFLCNNSNNFCATFTLDNPQYSVNSFFLQK